MDYLAVLLAALYAAVTSWQLKLILLLILADLVLGVSSALKLREFDWAQLGDFYATNVLPYALGYVVVYFVVSLLPTEASNFLGGDLSIVLSTVGVNFAFGVLVLCLGGSILRNARIVWSELPTPEPPPADTPVHTWENTM